jgi:hypothetical protein
VTFTSEIRPGAIATVEVVASKPGLLSAWLDFNSNGDWSDPEDRIFRDVPLSAGVNELTFLVAADAVATDRTFARFRLSTQAGLSFSGLAPDGEVEDYRVSIGQTVVGRHVFYNNSAWDGNNPAANALDDQAIALDKTALLPGQQATFANYTSYSRGINGIMVDVTGLVGVPAADAFQFRVGNSNDPAAWVPAPAPLSITTRYGEGQDGSDRVTIIWPERAIEKQWLQVTVLSDARGGSFGLARDDVFYFGNAIGETGNSSLNAIVNATDQILTRSNASGFSLVEIANPYDFDRNRLVNATDVVISRFHASGFSPLLLISAPDGGEGEE